MPLLSTVPSPVILNLLSPTFTVAGKLVILLLLLIALPLYVNPDIPCSFSFKSSQSISPSSFILLKVRCSISSLIEAASVIFLACMALFIKPFSPDKVAILIPAKISNIIIVTTNPTSVIPLLFIQKFLLFCFFHFIHRIKLCQEN